MTSTVRYKFVKNQTTTPLTISNFVSNCLINNDGDDRQERVIDRIITIADIGTNPGQLGDPFGAILDVIPITSTVLWFQVDVYRPEETTQQGMTIYNNYNSDVTPLSLSGAPEILTQSSLGFGLALDNTLRIADKAHNTDSAIAVGDRVIGKVYIGAKPPIYDVMSP